MANCHVIANRNSKCTLQFLSLFSLLGFLLFNGEFAIQVCGEQQVHMSLVPSASKSSWKATNQSKSLNLTLTPPSFQLVGTILLDILSYSGGSPRHPLELYWARSNFSTNPSSLQMVGTTGSSKLVSLNVSGINIIGKDAAFVTSDKGRVSLKPKNVTVTFKSITGTVAANSINKSNLVYMVPQSQLPTLNGNFLVGSESKLTLTLHGAQSFPLSNLLQSSAASAVVGNCVIQLTLNLQGVATEPKPVPGPGPSPVPALGPSPVPALGPSPVPAPGPAYAPPPPY